MLTSKRRARLRGLANGLTPIFQIGKGGLSDEFFTQIDDCLTARELIKIRTLESSPVSAREAAERVAAATDSEVVQVIGSVIILYRRNEKEPKIEPAAQNRP